MPALQTIQVSDQDLNRIQSNVQSALNSITGPLLGGTLVQNVSLKTGNPNPINHGLGRQPQIWVLCDQDTNTTVWRAAWSNTTVTLSCGADCIVSLFFN